MSVRNYVLDKAIDVMLYLVIDFISVYLSYHTLSLSSLPVDSLLVVLAVIGIAALVVTFIIAAPIHKKIEKRRSTGEASETAETSGLEVFTRAEVERKFPFESFVSQVKHGGELVLMVGAFSTRRYDTDTIKRLITEKNVTVTILLLAPAIYKKVGDGMINMTVEIERDFQWQNLIADIQHTLTLLCKLRRDLKELRSRLIIRTYDRTPTLSMIVIDPNTEDAIMQVGTYLSGPDARARFQIILSKKAREKVFKKYWAEYEMIYDKHSHEINYKKIESEFLS